jgi:5,10-methylene-tetrahydrofolate dehydrogenase/methenyl tetrahydrofolate cyclohydrolase
MGATMLESVPLVDARVERTLDLAQMVYDAGHVATLYSLSSDHLNPAIESYRRSLQSEFGRYRTEDGEPLMQMERLDFTGRFADQELAEAVLGLNESGEPGGTMIKMPEADRSQEEPNSQLIALRRDVDNARGEKPGDNRFRNATATSIRGLGELGLGVSFEAARKEAARGGNPKPKVAVIGRGYVGGALVDDLNILGYEPLVITSENKHRAEELPEYDVVMTAAGANTVRPEHVRAGQVIIDAGVRPVDDLSTRKGWHYSGDVDPKVYEIDGVIVTPRLRAVGLYTASIMARNTARAAAEQLMLGSDPLEASPVWLGGAVMLNRRVPQAVAS